MKIELHNYKDGTYQLIIPQGNDELELGNKIDRKEVLIQINKLLDLMEGTKR